MSARSPLSGVKQTLLSRAAMSVNDPLADIADALGPVLKTVTISTGVEVGASIS
jgi:hypothetical protein